MEEGEGGPDLPVFTGVVIAIIPSEEIECGYAKQLVGIVEGGGGSEVALRPRDQQIEDLSAVTHIIATSIDFPQYSEAAEKGVHVAKPSWIHQSARKGKLAGARQHSPDPSQYFQDVVLCCGDLPDGDQEAIIAGVMALGGQYTSSLTKLSTHIVTLSDEHLKCKVAMDKKVNCKIVLPHWFDACFRLGKKINERPYMFPNPPVLQSDLPRPPNSDSPHVEGATAAMPTGQLPVTPPPSPSKSRKNLNAFMSKKVMLSADLDIQERLKKTLEGMINYGGGTLTDDVDQADIYICQYRDGEDYTAASRARKEVANLAWLYHVINLNKYINPLGKLLHYPLPRNGIPGMQNMKVSISNYNGEARVYLENLIKYCGAEFTKTMKQDNTHLITAHSRSEKYEAAQEWNINIANHLWLEESFAKCCVQTLSNPRYTTFPVSTNLSEVCGQTPLDMKRVEQLYYPPLRESPLKTMRSPDAHAKSRLVARRAVPDSSAPPTSPTLHRGAEVSAPTPIAEDEETESEEGEKRPTPAKKAAGRRYKAAPTPSAKDVVMDDNEETAPQTAPRPRGRPRKSLATPRHVDDEKENFSPATAASATMTSGRAAKVKALDSIHGAAPDIAQFEKEMKRKGGVTHGGRRSSHLEDVSTPTTDPMAKSKKRKSDEGTYDATAEGSDLSDGETQAKPAAAKKAKTTAISSLPPVKYRMMVTGDDRWLGKMKQEGADKTKLRLLGVQLTTDPSEVDILVAPAIKRTRKFVAALASAPLVVDTKYLDAALEQNKLVDKPATLQDRKTEHAMGFTLTESLSRAKINKRRLLRGWSIFVTKDIPGGFETYKEIIEVNGGEAYLYQGRTGLKIPKPGSRNDPDAGLESQHQGEDADHDFVYLVSGASETEVKLWKTFRALAEKQGLRTRVVKSEWLLSAALSQQIGWRSEWEWDEAAVMSQRDR
ncbi:regulator of Ty1 Transposition [Teratosphaeriaceae sp. CCFEE 6253]|nr:regulator of Ty1 Transposition [Teratosphaeriaceae sp. CCFEE 6253]